MNTNNDNLNGNQNDIGHEMLSLESGLQNNHVFYLMMIGKPRHLIVTLTS